MPRPGLCMIRPTKALLSLRLIHYAEPDQLGHLLLERPLPRAKLVQRGGSGAYGGVVEECVAGWHGAKFKQVRASVLRVSLKFSA